MSRSIPGKSYHYITHKIHDNEFIKYPLDEPATYIDYDDFDSAVRKGYFNKAKQGFSHGIIEYFISDGIRRKEISEHKKYLMKSLDASQSWIAISNKSRAYEGINRSRYILMEIPEKDFNMFWRNPAVINTGEYNV